METILFATNSIPVLIGYMVVLITLFCCDASIARRWLISAVTIMFIATLLTMVLGMSTQGMMRVIEEFGFIKVDSLIWIMWVIYFILNLGFAVGMGALSIGIYKALGSKKASI